MKKIIMRDGSSGRSFFCKERSWTLVILLFVVLLVQACQRHASQSTDEENRKRIAKIAMLDEDIQPPQPGDWLDVHDEKGQTLVQYLASRPVRATEKRKLIYLKPVGSFSVDQLRIVNYTAEYLEIFYGLKTIVEDPVSDNIIPASARRVWGGDHEQLLTTHIFNNILLPAIPDDAVVVMAITTKDLYPSDRFNFVFGQARLKDRIGVTSIYRYTDEPLNEKNFNQCLERMIKTSSHEIGHMFSCQHCIHAVCVMNGSNSLWESDARPNRLCSECLSKLHWNLSFDIERRQKKLVEFMKRHQLKKDAAVLAQDLRLLESEKPSNIKGLYD